MTGAIGKPRPRRSDILRGIYTKNNSYLHPISLCSATSHQTTRIPPSRRYTAAFSKNRPSNFPPTSPLPSSSMLSTERKIEFTNPKGERLVGLYTHAAEGTVNTKSNGAVVILCHGYMANKDMCNFPPLAEALASAGISSYRFDHACAWRGQSERRGPFLMGNHDDEVADMAAAAALMRSRNKRVVCLLGHSKGGTNVVQYAATIGDIANVINLAGRFDVKAGVMQRFGEDIMDKLKASPDGISRVESDGFEWRMTLEDFENRANRPMELYAKTIKDKGDMNMLCLHGRQDKTIPWEESQLCAELAGAELAIIDGDHNFRGREASEQMIARVVEFCSSCL